MGGVISSDAYLVVHVFDNQQYRAVQVSHVPVKGLQTGPMVCSAVDQLP